MLFLERKTLVLYNNGGASCQKLKLSQSNYLNRIAERAVVCLIARNTQSKMIPWSDVYVMDGFVTKFALRKKN